MLFQTTQAKPSDRGNIPWEALEPFLNNLISVEGGYSDAKRGLLTGVDNTTIFIKYGTSESSKKWAKKEVEVYKFLTERNFPYIPRLLAVSPDETAFALEALTPGIGWDWSDTWTEARLDQTFAALDALTVIECPAPLSLFQPILTADDDGWAELLKYKELQTNLAQKLARLSLEHLTEDVRVHATRSAQFTIRHDSLVHNDVRCDNCPWRANTNEIKLVDWNWAELGDRRIESAAMLAHVQATGYQVLPKYKSRLDREALHWVAGVWFAAACKPIWHRGPAHLRDIQLRAGIAALTLSNTLTS